MIISASRRTDIPAFYSAWLMQRLREGYCTVVNPFNRRQVSRISLQPDDVEAMVFWSKNPAPLIEHLPELDRRGYRYYFQCTLNGYPTVFEPHVPKLTAGINTLHKLSGLVGPQRLIWRYDPIIISNLTPVEFHLENFAKIAACLQGYTSRAVISFVDDYRKAVPNFRYLARAGINIRTEVREDELAVLLSGFVRIAGQNGLNLTSCAEKLDLQRYGVFPGKCIDDQLIREVFGLSLQLPKDKFQRPECRCIQSKDIGFYDTCLHGCAYCYAGTWAAARRNLSHHFSRSPSLIGNFDAPSEKEAAGSKLRPKDGVQLKLFSEEDS